MEFTWVNRIDGVDDATADDINAVAHAVEDLNKEMQALSEVEVPTKLSQLENDVGYIAPDGETLTVSAYSTNFHGQTIDINAGAVLTLHSGDILSVNNNRIQNVKAPVNNADAANKAYVDNKKLSEFNNDAGYIAPTNDGYNLDLTAYNVNLSGRYTSISGEAVTISGVVEPTAADDAVNKGYVDNITGDIQTALEAIIAAQEALIGGAA